MPARTWTITEEPFPPYVEAKKRREITRKNSSGNYQPGENPPLSKTIPLSLAEQMKQ
jgi:hypothetical protein